MTDLPAIARSLAAKLETSSLHSLTIEYIVTALREVEREALERAAQVKVPDLDDSGPKFQTGYEHGIICKNAAIRALIDTPTSEAPDPPPIDMLLFCPSCGVQHVDRADGDWTNPPHRSHLCGACGTIWRPADVATNGAETIETKGKVDNWENWRGAVQSAEHPIMGSVTIGGNDPRDTEIKCRTVEIPLSDANDLDAVVHALGIEDSDTTPAEAVEELKAKIERLNSLINTPKTDNWFEGVRLEAAHQIERWGSDHDAGKGPLDWFWLIGFLAQKAAMSEISGDTEKARHHTISTSAALLNWFRKLAGENDTMRPGIDTPPGEGP